MPAGIPLIGAVKPFQRRGAGYRPEMKPSDPDRRVVRKPRSAWAGVLAGIGVAAFVDETVFHQLLHWHHFYDRSTSDAGLVSDGLFHAFGWFAIVFGLVLVADLRRGDRLSGRALTGGALTGAGAFQLYDGTIQHKLLGLHQIRYDVALAPYDWTWNVLAVLLLAAGVWCLRTTRAATA
jgi:uncharacterized membrane protein